MTEKEAKQFKLEIKLEEEIAQGIYCNMAIVNFSQTEFILDFVFVQPQEPKAKVRSRIITTPLHLKRLTDLLARNVQKYEEKFGAIEVPSSFQMEQEQ